MAHASYGNHSGTDGTRPDQRPKTPQAKTTRNTTRKGGEDEQEGQTPASGPHGDPALTNPDATPGAGSLPPAGASDGTDSTSS